MKYDIESLYTIFQVQVKVGVEQVKMESRLPLWDKSPQKLTSFPVNLS